MNPFQLQAEFARQWLGLATSMASAAMAASNMMAEQMASGWTRALSGATGHSNNAWPGNLWSGFAAPSATPSLPFANPFMNSAAPASWPTPPWMSALGWGAPTPALTSFFGPVTVTWTWPWGGASPFLPWSTGTSRPSNPGADLIDQVAASYRSASGYAVAAVMAPFGAALDPRTFGQPWWQTPPKRGLLN